MAEFPRDPDEASRTAEDAEMLDHARRPLSGFDALVMPSAMQTAGLMSFVSSVSETLDKITADLKDAEDTTGASRSDGSTATNDETVGP